MCILIRICAYICFPACIITVTLHVYYYYIDDIAITMTITAVFTIPITGLVLLPGLAKARGRTGAAWGSGDS